MTLIALLAALSVHDIYTASRAREGRMQSHIIHVAVSEVVGRKPEFLGDTNSSNILVEFGDYQCPPCKAANSEVSTLLQDYKGILKLEFRNYPLVGIHPNAMPAAVLCETARQEGKFWPAHDRLYAAELDERTIDDTYKILKITRHVDGVDVEKLAKKHIDEDIADAMRLGVDSTPTFILIRPDNTVLKMSNVREVREYL